MFSATESVENVDDPESRKLTSSEEETDSKSDCDGATGDRVAAMARTEKETECISGKSMFCAFSLILSPFNVLCESLTESFNDFISQRFQTENNEEIDGKESRKESTATIEQSPASIIVGVETEHCDGQNRGITDWITTEFEESSPFEGELAMDQEG